MSRIFFEELGIARIDNHLNVGSGSHAEQTAKIMTGFEPVLLTEKPDLIVVYGDVNSTVAAALVAAKLHIPVAHVEAGLRSGDRSMPEEVNRILTDQLSDWLFTPSADADQNLAREGIAAEKIHLVGNVMIDTLVKMMPSTEKTTAVHDLGLRPGNFVLATLHRPSNVDIPEVLFELLAALSEIGRRYPVVFPLHPRTRQRIRKLDSAIDLSNIRMLEPMGYVDFLSLTRNAVAVITDSGGMQEETTFLGVPCLTARPNTERPITIEFGTNRLVASKRDEILQAFEGIDTTSGPGIASIPLWDGKASMRIAEILIRQ